MKSVTAVLALVAVSAGCDVSANKSEKVQRGAQLVGMMGCNDCHTPAKFDPAIGMPMPDRSRLLSGHPAGAPEATGKLGANDTVIAGPTFTEFTLPFGKVYAKNLTPDPETGLGNWTEEEFIRTMRTGLWKGIGRPLMPPMPWMNLNAASDEELRAIFAYLKSIPPVNNNVPALVVPDAVIAGMAAAYEKITGINKP